MRYILAAFMLLLVCPAFGQDYSSTSKKAIKLFEKGRTYFMQKQDGEAENYLRKALDADERFAEAWYMLAQISLDRNNTAEAIDCYRQGLEIAPETNVAGFLRLAEMEYSIGRYRESLSHLERWKAFDQSDGPSIQKALDLEKDLAYSIYAVSNPVPFDPLTLGPAVNTHQFEYWPALSLDEKTLFFTVLGPPDPGLPPSRLAMQEDFYYVRLDNGEWKHRTALGAPVNTNSNEGAQALTGDGKLIFFTACNKPDGHGPMCDLYYSEVDQEGRWSPPKNLGDNINTKYSEKHPSVSPDGRILFFSSNRPGGKGDYDIWMSVKTGDSWSRPVNLGDSINTPGIEQSPFIHPDQQTLYFSSDGWPGLGRGDICLSRIRAGRSWSRAENLGYPINTFNDEIGFIVNALGTRAYFVTNRREGTDTDIFTFEIPEQIRPVPVSYITGRVYDARTMKGIAATFRLLDLSTGQLVAESLSNPGEGDFLVNLPAGSSYAFNVSHPGYLFYSDHFELEKDYSSLDPYRLDIGLEPISEGKSIVLKNLFFDLDSYMLKDASRVELDRLLEFLELNRNVHVEISGHTDNTGTREYNMVLSADRAREVVRYLTEHGIPEGRLVSKGYGDTLPLGDNNTDEGRQMNRRTELRIISR